MLPIAFQREGAAWGLFSLVGSNRAKLSFSNTQPFEKARFTIRIVQPISHAFPKARLRCKPARREQLTRQPSSRKSGSIPWLFEPVGLPPR
jgi:hypothetical protein